MTRLLRRTALLIVLLYALVVAALFAAQRSLLYPGSGRLTSAAEAGLAGVEDIVLATPDGERLVGLVEAAADRQGGHPLLPRQRRLALEPARPRQGADRGRARPPAW